MNVGQKEIKRLKKIFRIVFKKKKSKEDVYEMF